MSGNVLRCRFGVALVLVVVGQCLVTEAESNLLILNDTALTPESAVVPKALNKRQWHERSGVIFINAAAKNDAWPFIAFNLQKAALKEDPSLSAKQLIRLSERTRVAFESVTYKGFREAMKQVYKETGIAANREDLAKGFSKALILGAIESYKFLNTQTGGARFDIEEAKELLDKNPEAGWKRFGKNLKELVTGPTDWATPQDRRNAYTNIIAEVDPILRESFIDSQKHLANGQGAGATDFEYWSQNAKGATAYAVQALRHSVAGLGEAVEDVHTDTKLNRVGIDRNHRSINRNHSSINRSHRSIRRNGNWIRNNTQLNKKILAGINGIAESQSEMLAMMKKGQVEKGERKEIDAKLAVIDRNARTAHAAIDTLRAILPNDKEVIAAGAVAGSFVDVVSVLKSSEVDALIPSLETFLSLHGIIFGLGKTLFSVFGPQPPPIEVTILKQIMKLRQQVANLSVDMRSLTQGIKNDIADLKKMTLNEFDNLNLYLRGAFGRQEEILRGHTRILRQILTQIYDLGKENFEGDRQNQQTKWHSWCSYVANANYLDGVTDPDSRQRLRARYCRPDTYRSHMESICGQITDGYLSRYLCTGASLNSRISSTSDPGDRVTKVNFKYGHLPPMGSPFFRLRAFNEASQNLEIPIQGNPINASDYAKLSNAFSTGTMLHSKVHPRLPHMKQLRSIAEIGKRGREYLRNIAPLGANGKPNIYHLIAYAHNYDYQISRLQELLKHKIHSRIKNNEDLHGIDPTKPLNDQVPVLTSSELNLSDGHLIRPCVGTNVRNSKKNLITPHALPANLGNLAQYSALIPNAIKFLTRMKRGHVNLCYSDVELHKPSKTYRVERRPSNAHIPSLVTVFQDNMLVVVRGKPKITFKIFYKPNSDSTTGLGIKVGEIEVVDSEVVDWHHEYWAAVWGDILYDFGAASEHSLEDIKKKVENRGDLDAILARNTAIGKSKPEGEFRSMLIMPGYWGVVADDRFNHIREKRWGALEKTLLAQKGPANSPAQMEAVKEVIWEQAKKSFLQQMEEMIIDGEGTLGDALIGVAGAKKQFEDALFFGLGAASQDDEKLKELFAKIPGQGDLALRLIRSLRSDNTAKTIDIERLIQSVRTTNLTALLSYLSDPNTKFENLDHRNLDLALWGVQKAISHQADLEGGTSSVPMPFNGALHLGGKPIEGEQLDRLQKLFFRYLKTPQASIGELGQLREIVDSNNRIRAFEFATRSTGLAMNFANAAQWVQKYFSNKAYPDELAESHLLALKRLFERSEGKKGIYSEAVWDKVMATKTHDTKFSLMPPDNAKIVNEAANKSEGQGRLSAMSQFMVDKKTLFDPKTFTLLEWQETYEEILTRLSNKADTGSPNTNVSIHAFLPAYGAPPFDFSPPKRATVGGLSIDSERAQLRALEALSLSVFRNGDRNEVEKKAIFAALKANRQETFETIQTLLNLVNSRRKSFNKNMARQLRQLEYESK